MKGSDGAHRRRFVSHSCGHDAMAVMRGQPAIPAQGVGRGRSCAERDDCAAAHMTENYVIDAEFEHQPAKGLVVKSLRRIPLELLG